MAVIELGALVCTVRKPDCGACPWQAGCAQLTAGRPANVHVGRRRSQAWHSTNRQARGLMMARLRTAPDGQYVEAAELRACATRAGTQISGGVRDPRQPIRALSTLLADGLIATNNDGTTYRLPWLATAVRAVPVVRRECVWGLCGQRRRSHRPYASLGQGAHGPGAVTPVEL